MAAAALQAAGDVLSGLFNYAANDSTNAMNLKIARENNAHAEKLFNQQLAWTEDMWNKSNEYNAPENQVAMLRKAGINPAAVYGTGSTSMTSSPTVPSAPAMQGATMVAPDMSFIGNSIDKGVNAFYENQILANKVKESGADAQIRSVQAEFESKSLTDRLIKVLNDRESSTFEKDAAKESLDILRATKNNQIVLSDKAVQMQNANYEEAVNRIAESKLKQEAMQIANKYAPQMNDALLRQYYANISQMYAAARASDASAVYSSAAAALANIQAAGVKLDNKQKDSIMGAYIDKAWNEADNAYWNAAQSKKTFNSGWLGSAVPNWPGANEPSDRSEMGTNKAFDDKSKHRVPRNRSKSGVR